jgi:hypothetical protein
MARSQKADPKGAPATQEVAPAEPAAAATPPTAEGPTVVFQNDRRVHFRHRKLTFVGAKLPE